MVARFQHQKRFRLGARTRFVVEFGIVSFGEEKKWFVASTHRAKDKGKFLEALVRSESIASSRTVSSAIAPAGEYSSFDASVVVGMYC